MEGEDHFVKVNFPFDNPFAQLPFSVTTGAGGMKTVPPGRRFTHIVEAVVNILDSVRMLFEEFDGVRVRFPIATEVTVPALSSKIVLRNARKPASFLSLVSCSVSA
jgi:hypothetical protein